MSPSPWRSMWGYAAPACPERGKPTMSWLLPAPAHSPGPPAGCRQAAWGLQGPQKTPVKKRQTEQFLTMWRRAFPKYILLQDPNRQILLAALALVSRGRARWKEASCISREGGFAKSLCKASGLCWWITAPESNPSPHKLQSADSKLEKITGYGDRARREKNRSSVLAKSFSAPRTPAKYPAAQGEPCLPMNNFCWGF